MYPVSLAWLKKYNLLFFDEIDGTNAEAMRLARAGVTGNYIICAKKQTDGRGRNGKYWHSEEGNFFATLLLADLEGVDPDRFPELSFVTALALHSTVSRLAKTYSEGHHDVKLKWPNDVMVNGKKISGILLETSNFKGRNYLAIGVGINNISSPGSLEKPASCFLEEGIKIKDSGEILSLLVNYFQKYFTIWLSRGMINIRRNWLANAYKLKEVVTVDDGVRRISGEFTDVDLNGNIRIKLAGGQIFSMSAGQVFFPSGLRENFGT